MTLQDWWRRRNAHLRDTVVPTSQDRAPTAPRPRSDGAQGDRLLDWLLPSLEHPGDRYLDMPHPLLSNPRAGSTLKDAVYGLNDLEQMGVPWARAARDAVTETLMRQATRGGTR